MFKVTVNVAFASLIFQFFNFSIVSGIVTWEAQARREERGGGGGATGALAPSHRPQRSTFLLINDLKQSELIVIFDCNSLIV